jgi:linoleoyl-CoA desaturase
MQSGEVGMTQQQEVHGRPAGQSGQAKGAILRLEFGENRAFEMDMRQRVDEYFQQGSGRSKTANWQMYLKTAVILACFVTSYVLLVFVAKSVWQALSLSILLGLSTAGIGFNIAHDGGHKAYSKAPWVNKLAAMTMDLVGVSSYGWFWKHAVIHHRYVNITGYDTDIDIGILGRLSPHSKRLPFHRWQRFYLWPLYGVLAAKMQFVDDFKRVIRGRIGQHGFPRPTGWELAIFVTGKMVFLAWAFCVPFLLHAFGVVLFYYGTGVLILGIAMSVVFQLPHCVEEAKFPMPREDTGRMENPWAIHQASVTLDFARGNKVVSWPVGGLNYHLEHHLFPTICHIHYPAITKIVQETCRDHRIKCAEHKSLWTGLAAHYRWLRQMGLPDADCKPSQPVL